MNRRFLMVCGLTFALSLPVARAQTSAQMAAAQKLAKTTCFLCHGEGGLSISPTFPRLAGQQAAYVEAQLKAFKDQTRGDPNALAYMYGMASQLHPAMMKALGEYFQSLTPAPAKAEPAKDVSAGKDIFEHGIPSLNVPACQTCHGSKAAGLGQFPRLAGQHTAYIVMQLRAFKSGVRASPIMGPIAHNLTEAQMNDVADYVRSLP